MGDRRVGDRRSPEKGVIKIPFERAIAYLVIATVLIISISANIVLAIRNKYYKEDIEYYRLILDQSAYYSDYDYYDEEDEDDEEYTDENETNSNAETTNTTID